MQWCDAARTSNNYTWTWQDKRYSPAASTALAGPTKSQVKLRGNKNFFNIWFQLVLCMFCGTLFSSSACQDVRPGSKVCMQQISAGSWEFEVGARGFFHNQLCMLKIAWCERQWRAHQARVWMIPASNASQRSLEPCFRRRMISSNVWSQSINHAKPVIGLF